MTRRYKLPGFPGHMSHALKYPFDSNMADKQDKLSNCSGNQGLLVGTLQIILTKCSLSCGQHFMDPVHIKISTQLLGFI